MKSLVLVLIQFAALGFIFVTGPLFPASLFPLAVEFVGITLGAWALHSIGFGNFNITPNPVRGAHLVTRGPYTFIRHPMYSALLLTTLPLVLAAFSPFRAAVWLVLLADFIVKLNYEEQLLTKKFKGYAQYKKHTYRLIPFVY
jgi:protein-S-isoprenylcysteine O-methyltransferase Ste14